MELFREEYLTVQNEYLSEDPAKGTSFNKNDVEVSNDDLGENAEVKPIGDTIKESEVYNAVVDPEDDDDEDEDFIEGDDEDLEQAELPDLDSDEDDLLDEEDEDDDVFVDETPPSPLTNNSDFVTRHPERKTGRGISDQPGLPGLDRSL